MRNNSWKALPSASQRVHLVKSVYGDPVVVGNRTVIPIAQVRYGFGGGAGHPKGDEAAGGGGGGGGVSARPSAALEITPEGTRFIVFQDRRATAIALALGFVLGAAVVALTGEPRSEVARRSE
jgi:uncharacterized spore protein YtfJ